MNDTQKTASLVSKKIEVVTLVETGIILENKNKEKTTIPFSTIQKTYIKKHKFSFPKKIGIISFFLTLIVFSSFYLPIELAFALLILVVPLAVKINTYKWYALNVLLNDATLIKKIFFLEKKQEYIKLVQLIKKEVYYSQINSQISLIEPLESNTADEDSAFQTLSIA